MRASLILISCLATSFPALGGSLVYTSLTDWQASSPGSNSVLDFESSSTGYYGSITYSPYTFTASSGGEWILGGAAAGTGSGHYLTTDLSSTLNIALGSGVYGLAFNLGSNSGSPASATIVATDVNGAQYTTSGWMTASSAGPAEFWGLRTSVQLASVHITFTGVLPQVDNVRYANAAYSDGGEPVVPEPAGWLLMLSGGGLLCAARLLTSKSGGSSRRFL